MTTSTDIRTATRRRGVPAQTLVRLLAPMLAVLALVLAAPAAQASATSGQFTVRCALSHAAAVDPIVMFGMTGMGHSHDFFGNRSTNQSSTHDTLRGSRATTCNRATDTSAYWAPSVFQRGKLVQPENMRVYYRTGGITGTSIRAFPTGLKLLAGSAKATAATKQPISVASWACTIPGGGQAGDEVEVQDIPATCNGQPLRVKIVLPQCWDGKNLDSPDHKSHMAYAVSRKCPATHPVILPQVTMTVRYWVKDTGGITLASGGQHSIHADLFAAWQPGEQEKLVRNCIHSGVNCGETGTGRAPTTNAQVTATTASTRTLAVTASRPADPFVCRLGKSAARAAGHRRLS
jgi:hypothetical protein